MKLLITGGAGFIGSNFIRHILNRYSDYHIINLDKLTYAGNPDNLRDIEKDSRYKFIKGDICDIDIVNELAKEVEVIINFAAETHVDRSIIEPGGFIKTDIFGTYLLLEASKKYKHKRYLQISTDEVYGSIEDGSFKETDPLKPSSPYSSSKTGADLLALSYFVTYKLPVIITRSSNNFGPYQYPEKVIPLFITNAIEDKALPIYGDGKNIRDWIYVLDNCSGIDIALHKGKDGEIYNIGGGNQRMNIDIAKMIIKGLEKRGELLTFVKDRLGHDRRYSVNCQKIEGLGFVPQYDFEVSLQDTIRWYKENEWWWKKIKSGEYKKYYKEVYG
ncbi:MAG: dTDP-glucose 4,6-dehydratase [Nitrospirota bacterium]